MLLTSLKTATRILSKNEKGFFLMAEGSMIDWGAHDNNTEYVTSEMIDFDQAIAAAIDFAEDRRTHSWISGSRYCYHSHI